VTSVRSGIAALTAATAAAPLVSCGSSGAQGLASHPSGAAPCAQTGARIIRNDSRAQVYTLHKLVYGCDRGSHRITKLGDTTACIAAARVDHLALADTRVAYGVDRCGVDAGFTVVVVRRLTDGKRLAGYRAVSGPGLVESYESIGSIVVKRGGSVAWIGSQRSIASHGSRIEVAEGQRGKRSTLDSGSGIVGSSLRLSL
jgi:hypothetical protein